MLLMKYYKIQIIKHNSW